MTPIPVAVFAGGYSAEAAVSHKSAAMVMNNIDRERFDPVLISVSREGWAAEYNGAAVPVSRSDLSVETAQGILQPKLAFIMIHGTPGEDGILQGYLDTIGMPYTTGGVLNMALTFDKALTTQSLRAMGLPTTTGVLLRSGADLHPSEIIERTGLPCFVKPNRGGSSIGMTKVNHEDELESAINLARREDAQVIVEGFITGTEVTCGVIPWEGGIRALPVTEIVSHNAFFDFDAKYHGKSEEITPARIAHHTTKAVQELSERIYRALECRGMIRVDMIISNDQPYVIEVNTVPGFTEASIIPQQAAAVGIGKTALISCVIEGSLPVL